jgi:hypothetical protein
MAVTSRKPGLLWSRLHFLLRFLGLTGALCAAVGLALIQPRFSSVRALFQDVSTPVQAFDFSDHVKIGGQLFLWGAAAALLALFVEIVNAMLGVAGRRSAFGFNAVLQIALATVLLIVVNLLSTGYDLRQFPLAKEKLDDWAAMPGYNARIDLTRSKSFTLPGQLRKRLEELDPNGQTTIIVYQRHKTFSGVTDKPDRYDYAAEKKVVEKVKDLVQLLREAGPRFKVEVLDVEEEGFDDKLDRLTKDAPELRKAIDAAPENSIFVSAKDPADPNKTFVQQMSFNELYQLDRVRSQKDNDGRGNLVLLGQGDGRGVRPFAERILNVQQRKPRVGVLAIHELLTTESSNDTLTLAGMRKSLEANGYEVRDVVLKKGWEAQTPGLEPTADTFEESKLERVESELETLDKDLKDLDKELAEQEEDTKKLREMRGEKLQTQMRTMMLKYVGVLIQGDLSIKQNQETVLGVLRQNLEQKREERDAKRAEQKKLLGEKAVMDLDRIGESRRISDVKAKLGYAVADCDVLFIPRLTRMSETGDPIRARLFRLSREQAEAIKEFMKAGKPVFACLGPSNEPAAGRMPPEFGLPGVPDDFELALAELGFTLSKHTVLFPSDAKSFTQQSRSLLRSETKVDTPAIDFDSPIGTAYARLQAGREREDNPLRKSLRVTAHSLGGGFDLRLRFPRPVYYSSPEEKRFNVLLAGAVVGAPSECWLASLTMAAYASTQPVSAGSEEDPTFLLTTAKGAWNDPQPFMTLERRPRYVPPQPNDPDNGTLDAKRRGAFPVGAAVEATVPEEWGAGKGQKVRVVVIGQGDLFCGPKLSPAKERLLMQTTSWLLERDDYLPRDENEWRYPRLGVKPGDWQHRAWILAMLLGLPLLSAYLGFVVLLYRRLR